VKLIRRCHNNSRVLQWAPCTTTSSESLDQARWWVTRYPILPGQRERYYFLIGHVLQLRLPDETSKILNKAQSW